MNLGRFSNGLGSPPRLVTRGLSSSATPTGPIVAGIITRGLGIGQLLLTRGLAVPQAEILPPSLAGAIARKVATTDSLSELTDLSLTRAKPNPGPSYSVIHNTGSGNYFTSSSSEWKDDRITIRILASDAVTVNRLGLAFAAAVKAWGSLDFEGGYSIPLFETGRRHEEVKSKRAGENGSFLFELIYSARCRRT